MSDLISRQAMKNMITNHWSDFSNAANYRTAMACVDAVPTVTPAEPKIIHCEDCKYGMRDPSFPYQWFCKFKGDEWNNGDYFCGHARKREVTE